VCSKPTNRVLFRGSPAEVFICSIICENQFIESLSYNKSEHQKVLQYLDQKIRKAKLYETIGWTIAALGLVLVFLGVFLTNSPPTKALLVGPTLFITGSIPLTGGALSTIHFGGNKEKLTLKRKQIA